MSKKEKIPLNQPQAGLNAAFAGLELGGLPAGPAEPVPTQPPEPTRKAGRVVLRKETSGRGGKAVLVVHDFAAHHTAEAIEALGKRLRAACGCGGTVRKREIEIQGDQPAKVRALLEAEGFQVAGVR